MIHEQLISRNVVELSDVIRTFHKLNECYQDQFVIYMDSHNWELFDTRIGKTIISHEFKHFNQFTSDMRKLMRDITNVTLLSATLGSRRKPKPYEVWSIKSIIKKYSLNDKYFFSNTNLKNYVINGIINKKEDFADCD